jgi:hypothetical protein
MRFESSKHCKVVIMATLACSAAEEYMSLESFELSWLEQAGLIR